MKLFHMKGTVAAFRCCGPLRLRGWDGWGPYQAPFPAPRLAACWVHGVNAGKGNGHGSHDSHAQQQDMPAFIRESPGEQAFSTCLADPARLLFAAQGVVISGRGRLPAYNMLVDAPPPDNAVAAAVHGCNTALNGFFCGGAGQRGWARTPRTCRRRRFMAGTALPWQGQEVFNWGRGSSVTVSRCGRQKISNGEFKP